MHHSDQKGPHMPRTVSSICKAASKTVSMLVWLNLGRWSLRHSSRLCIRQPLSPLSVFMCLCVLCRSRETEQEKKDWCQNKLFECLCVCAHVSTHMWWCDRERECVCVCVYVCVCVCVKPRAVCMWDQCVCICELSPCFTSLLFCGINLSCMPRLVVFSL